MKLPFITTSFVLSLLLSQSALAAHPCKEKHEAKHEAQKSLRQCLEVWGQNKADAADPTDDCSSKTSAFVAAAKNLKACHIEMKTKAK